MMDIDFPSWARRHMHAGSRQQARMVGRAAGWVLYSGCANRGVWAGVLRRAREHNPQRDLAWYFIMPGRGDRVLRGAGSTAQGGGSSSETGFTVQGLSLGDTWGSTAEMALSSPRHPLANARNGVGVLGTIWRRSKLALQPHRQIEIGAFRGGIMDIDFPSRRVGEVGARGG